MLYFWIPNKQELQQFAFNDWSNIGHENLFKKCYNGPFSFLVIYTNYFSTKNPLHSEKSVRTNKEVNVTLLKRIWDKKMQYDLNREAKKISALSSDKINRYEYLTGKEVLPSMQIRIIEQVKFVYSPLGKASEE